MAGALLAFVIVKIGGTGATAPLAPPTYGYTSKWNATGSARAILVPQVARAGRAVPIPVHTARIATTIGGDLG
jgi:hypothetical protein